MKKKLVLRLLALTVASGMAVTDVYGSTGRLFTVYAAQETDAYDMGVNATVENIAFDTAKDWDEIKTGDIGAAARLTLTSDTVPTVGSAITADVLLPVKDGETDRPAFTGALKFTATLKLGNDWHSAKSKTYLDLTSDSFTSKVTINGTEYFKAVIEVPFGDTVEGNKAGSSDWQNEAAFSDIVDANVAAVDMTLAGYQCNYSGSLSFADAALHIADATDTPSTDLTPAEPVTLADFSTDADGWTAAGGYAYSHGQDGVSNASPVVTYDEAAAALKVSLDYTKNSNAGWSEAKIAATFAQGGQPSIAGFNRLCFDVYIPETDSSAFKFKAFANDSDYKEAINVDTELKATDFAQTSEIDGYKKAAITLNIDPADKQLADLTLGLIGVCSSFKGDIYIDNIRLTQAAVPVTDVEITATTGGAFSVADLSGMPDRVALADRDATASTRALASYLRGLSGKKQVLFGHQNSTFKSVHTGGATSDVFDITGSEAGLFGIDTLSLSGCESGQDTTEKGIAASIAASKKAYAGGSIISLSCHMPNFTNEKIIVTPNGDGTNSYDFHACDFAESKDLSNNCAEQILPGGAYNEAFRAYLDMIAQYANALNEDGIPVLFRPFHENSGGWFWWGASTKPEVYRAMWRYTVDYLSAKGVHNMLYVYSPNGPIASEQDYLSRYPGDAYVDVLAFDYYDDYADVTKDTGAAFFAGMDTSCQIIAKLAADKNKICAIAESGIRMTGAGKDSLMVSGNPTTGKDWYGRLLDVASKNGMSYFLLWANFDKNNFFVPYLTSEGRGHEMINDFIDFYNEGASIFGNGTRFYEEAGKKEVLNTGYDTVNGYMISPTDYDIIKDTVTFTGSVKNADEAYFTVQTAPDAAPVRFAATPDKADGLYKCTLTAAQLSALGKTELGVISFYGKKTGGDAVLLSTAQFICLNKDKSTLPANVFDNFEFYYGNQTLLASTYGPHNSAANCQSSMTLDDKNHAGGSYGGAFSYTLTYNGSEVWTGGLGKSFTETDFTAYNALSMWVKPDGNGQKMVIQIKGVDGKEYEAYLTGFGKTTGAKYVTIPFSAFRAKSDGTPLSDTKKISGFALWCNSVPENYTGQKDADGNYTVNGVFTFDDMQAVTLDDSTLALADENGLIITDTPPVSPDNGSTGNNSSGSNSSGGSYGTADTGSTEAPAANGVKNTVVSDVKELADGTFTDAAGKTLANTIIKTNDGTLCITDENGRKRTNVIVTTTDNAMYYVNTQGAVVTGKTIVYNNARYFAKADGTLATGEFCTTPSGRLVYARANGKLIVNHTFTVDGTRYFAKASGAVAKNTFSKTPNGNRVYSNAKGEVITGRSFKVKGSRYYAKKNGAIAVKTWIRTGNKRYYCSASGKITKIIMEK